MGSGLSPRCVAKEEKREKSSSGLSRTPPAVPGPCRDGLGAAWAVGMGLGGRRSEKRGIESPERFCGVGNGSTEVSPVPPRGDNCSSHPNRFRSFKSASCHCSQGGSPCVGDFRSPSPSCCEGKAGAGVRDCGVSWSSQGGWWALPPSLPGSIYRAGFGGWFAKNTRSLQVSGVRSERIRHSGEIDSPAAVNIPGNRWGM